MTEPAPTSTKAEPIKQRQFALFGGTPTFDTPQHVNKPNAGDRATFDALCDQVWNSRWFTNDGALVKRLERALEDYLGVRNCVIMSSGTSAMAALVQALELRGAVVLPSFTFISTAHVLQSMGVRPVFCDIHAADAQIDVDSVERVITSQTSAIIATHMWGRVCAVEALQEIADQRGIHLIFDAAHAFGSKHGSSLVGGFGDAEVFSFQANKTFHSGEGGAVTTNNDSLANTLRSVRNFGFAGYDQVDRLGTNAKLPELSAALGLANLAAYEEHAKKTKQVWEAYRADLSSIDGVSLVRAGDADGTNGHYVPCFVDPGFALPRDKIIEILHAENVLARRYFYPGNHRMEPYHSLYPDAVANLSVTEDIASRVLVLPAGAEMEIKSVEKVCNLLREIMDNGRAIRDQWPTKAMGSRPAADQEET